MMHSVMASPNEANECVKNIISCHIINKPVVWIDGTDNHEAFDVTFTVPISNGKVIHISYRL